MPVLSFQRRRQNHCIKFPDCYFIYSFSFQCVLNIGVQLLLMFITHIMTVCASEYFSFGQNIFQDFIPSLHKRNKIHLHCISLDMLLTLRNIYFRNQHALLTSKRFIFNCFLFFFTFMFLQVTIFIFLILEIFRPLNVMRKIKTS